MTKKGIEESQLHLQLKSSKTTLTSNSGICMNGSKGGHAAGAGIACGGKEKGAPVFASGEICAVSFTQFVTDFNDRAPFQLNWRLCWFVPHLPGGQFPCCICTC